MRCCFLSFFFLLALLALTTSSSRRTQADQVYNLGINRRATPLDRLKRSYLDFQARMLVAPPAPSLPRATATSSASNPDSRSILSSSTSRSAAAPSTGGTGVGAKGNGGMFAVFRDDSGGSAGAEGKEAGWEEFGTVKGRQRENNEEKKEWQGEVMLQKGAASVPKAGGFKLEVYRDEVRLLLLPLYPTFRLTWFSCSPLPLPPPFRILTIPRTSSPAPLVLPPKQSSSAPTPSRTTPPSTPTSSRATRSKDSRSSLAHPPRSVRAAVA